MSHLCMPPLTTTMRDRASGRFVPTFDLVESYYSNHGVPIEEDKDYDYNGRYSLQTASEKDKWYIKEGERRLNYISTVSLVFMLLSVLTGEYGLDKERPISIITMIVGGEEQISGKMWIYRKSFLFYYGYFSKKLVDYQAIVSDDVAMTQDAVPFPSIRLADLYYCMPKL